MKNKHAGLLVLTLLLVGTSGCASSGAGLGATVRSPSPEITMDVFFDTLGPYGSWIDVDIYGRVWLPNVVEVGWRPYTHGSWVYTSAGWTWNSDWRWGWAPFHYGRWFHHGQYGWVWVPGAVWAPAWVAWREGDGWLGWAPLPPRARWSVGVGLDLGALDLSIAIASDGWIFVSDRYFLDPRLHSRIVDRGRNSALLGMTRNVTRYAAEGQRVIERSVPVERLERALGEPVSRYRIDELSKPPRAKTNTVVRDRVKVYRPNVQQTPTKKTSRGGKGRRPS